MQVIVTRESGTAEPQDPNRWALQGLDRFLAEADDLTPQEWSEPEKVIEDHPLRIRNDACRPGKVDEIGNVPERKARDGAAGAVEEDARLTALFLWTLQSTNLPAATGAAQAGGSAAGNGEAEAEEDAQEGDDEDDEETPRKKTGGFTLVYDVVRRFAQPLGIHLPDWEGGCSKRRRASSGCFRSPSARSNSSRRTEHRPWRLASRREPYPRPGSSSSRR